MQEAEWRDRVKSQTYINVAKRSLTKKQTKKKTKRGRMFFSTNGARIIGLPYAKR